MCKFLTIKFWRAILGFSRSLPEARMQPPEPKHMPQEPIYIKINQPGKVELSQPEYIQGVGEDKSSRTARAERKIELKRTEGAGYPQPGKSGENVDVQSK